MSDQGDYPVHDSRFDQELVASDVDDALEEGAIRERQPRSRDVPVSALPASLRLIGYWRPKLGESRWPDPKDFVDPTWSEAERNVVADHLVRGRTLLEYRGLSDCRFCGEFVGSKLLTDRNYCWPEGLAHYLIQHDVRLPDEFVSHVLGVVAESGTAEGQAPEFDDFGQRLRGGGYDDEHKAWIASRTQLFPGGERREVHPPNWFGAELDRDWWSHQVGCGD